MAHVGGKIRKLHLDIGSFPVPAKERMDGEGMPQVMDPREGSGNCADVGLAKKAPKAMANACWGIATSIPMHQERGFGIRWEALGMPHCQIGFHFAGSIPGKGKDARFVELAGSDQKGPLYGRIVAQGQVRQFTPPHPSRVEEHHRETIDLPPHHAVRMGAKAICCRKDAKDLVL
jgi:hypothetical protein